MSHTVKSRIFLDNLNVYETEFTKLSAPKPLNYPQTRIMRSELISFRLMLLLSFFLIAKYHLAQEDTPLTDEVIGISKEQNKLLIRGAKNNIVLWHSRGAEALRTFQGDTAVFNKNPSQLTVAKGEVLTIFDLASLDTLAQTRLQSEIQGLQSNDKGLYLIKRNSQTDILNGKGEVILSFNYQNIKEKPTIQFANNGQYLVLDQYPSNRSKGAEIWSLKSQKRLFTQGKEVIISIDIPDHSDLANILAFKSPSPQLFRIDLKARVKGLKKALPFATVPMFDYENNIHSLSSFNESGLLKIQYSEWNETYKLYRAKKDTLDYITRGDLMEASVSNNSILSINRNTLTFQNLDKQSNQKPVTLQVGNPVSNIFFYPDNTHFALFSSNGYISIYDFKNLQLIREFKIANNVEPIDIINWKGKPALLCINQTIDLENGEQLSSFTHEEDSIEDKKTKGKVTLGALQSEKLNFLFAYEYSTDDLKILKEPILKITSFHKNINSKLVLVGLSRSAKIWDMNNDNIIGGLSTKGQSVKYVTLSPDSKLSLVYTRGNNIKIYDSYSGEEKFNINSAFSYSSNVTAKFSINNDTVKVIANQADLSLIEKTWKIESDTTYLVNENVNSVKNKYKVVSENRIDRIFDHVSNEELFQDYDKDQITYRYITRAPMQNRILTHNYIIRLDSVYNEYLKEINLEKTLFDTLRVYSYSDGSLLKTIVFHQEGQNPTEKDILSEKGNYLIRERHNGFAGHSGPRSSKKLVSLEDGKYVGIGFKDIGELGIENSELVLWDTYRKYTRENTVLNVELNNAETRLILHKNLRTIEIWNTLSRKALNTLTIEEGKIHKIGFTDDDNIAYCLTSKHELILWDATNGSLLKRSSLMED